jgi:hypothetical protein
MSALDELRKRNEKRRLERSLLPVSPIVMPLTDSEQNMVNELDSYFLGVAEKHGIDLGDPEIDDWNDDPMEGME